MPNKKSAKKELRKSRKRQAINAKLKNDLKRLIKDARKAIDLKSDEAKVLVAKALKELDKAAQKKLIKKNTRDRKKSRLHKRLNAFKK